MRYKKYTNKSQKNQSKHLIKFDEPDLFDPLAKGNSAI